MIPEPMEGFLDVVRKMSSPSIYLEDMEVGGSRFYRLVSDVSMTPFLESEEMERVMSQYLVVITSLQRAIEENVEDPTLRLRLCEVNEREMFAVLSRIIEMGD